MLRSDWLLKGYLLITTAYGTKRVHDLQTRVRPDTGAAIVLASPLLWPAYAIGDYARACA